MTVLKNTFVYLKIGDASPKLVYLDAISIKFDQYGTIWAIDSDTSIRWWNYDLAPNDTSFKAILNPTADNPNGFIDDVESFILDENNQFVVGYKTLSGQTYPILTLDEMKEILKDYSIIDTNTYTIKHFLPLLQLFLQLLLMFLLLLLQQLALLLLPQPQVLLLLLQKQP